MTGFRIGAGTQVTAAGEYGRTDFQQQAPRSDLTGYAAKAKLSQALARTGRLAVEYEYRKASLAGKSNVRTSFGRRRGVARAFDQSPPDLPIHGGSLVFVTAESADASQGVASTD